MEQRMTFRFFRSFYDAALAIDDKAVQADFLMAICQYALDGVPPDVSGMTAALFNLVRPNIDASIKKSESGSAGGKQTSSKRQANAKQTASTLQANSKQTASTPEAKKEEGRRKNEVGSITPHTPQGDFEAFWQAYPKKVGKIAAKKAFERVNVPLETLLTAIGRQKCGAQWSKDGGQYIPNPATWLNQGRWEDVVEPVKVVTAEPAYNPGAAELASIARLRALRDELKSGDDNA